MSLGGICVAPTHPYRGGLCSPGGGHVPLIYFGGGGPDSSYQPPGGGVCVVLGHPRGVYRVPTQPWAGAQALCMVGAPIEGVGGGGPHGPYVEKKELLSMAISHAPRRSHAPLGGATPPGRSSTSGRGHAPSRRDHASRLTAPPPSKTPRRCEAPPRRRGSAPLRPLVPRLPRGGSDQSAGREWRVGSAAIGRPSGGAFPLAAAGRRRGGGGSGARESGEAEVSGGSARRGPGRLGEGKTGNRAKSGDPSGKGGVCRDGRGASGKEPSG